MAALGAWLRVAGLSADVWIPAFAGMTGEKSGMTGRRYRGMGFAIPAFAGMALLGLAPARYSPDGSMRTPARSS